MKHECDNCGHMFEESELERVSDLLERVEPGATMPSGQCPECGALCYPEEDQKDQAVVVVNIIDGVVSQILANKHLRVIVLDDATEGSSKEDGVVTIDGASVFVTDTSKERNTGEDCLEVSPSVVTNIVQQVDSLYADSNTHFTAILQHRIKWWVRGENAPTEMDETSVEHIENFIRKGYNQGELVIISKDGETEYRGWWSIEANQCE